MKYLIYFLYFLKIIQSIMPLPNWSPTAIWNEDSRKLLNDFKIITIPSQTIDNIDENTKKFPVQFPTTTNKCKFLSTKTQEDILTRNVNSVYPALHESVLSLCADFILYKRKYGSSIEKNYYENFTIKDLINKMLSKRAVSFLGSDDQYQLLNGVHGVGRWESVGTDKEDSNSPLNINDVMSYDELKLSALLSVSSFTYFINNGSRTNIGKYEENRNAVEDNGIIVGMIGTRLEKSRVMEYEDIVITQNQNIKENGFGANIEHSIPKLFANFYQEESLTYEEASKKVDYYKTGRYNTIFNTDIFDNYLYYKRLGISVDTLLVEANSRAKNSEQSAYVHVVGLGLGVWMLSNHQTKIYMDTFAERITALGEKLNNVSDIRFAYIRYNKCGNYGNGEIFSIKNHPNGGIKIHISNEDPHVKLTGEDAGKLLVVSYAWDGNALPGNEYWNGSLDGSGDPAAACSTQVCEIHNPHINPLVCADNLRIVTEDGVFTVEEYKKIVSDRSKS